MIYKKSLILSRYHDDLANPIYNAYFKGIYSQCERVYFLDYFRLLYDLGKVEFEKYILDFIDKEKIDLVFLIFVSGDSTLDPKFVQQVANNRFLAMVFWDMEQFFEQIDRYYAQLADLVILSANHEYEHILNSYGVNTICSFSLFDSDKYKKIANVEKTIDVSFIGEVTKGNRKEYISYLEENGINIESFGVGTKNGKVSFSKVVEIFNKSKINLNFTDTYTNSVYSYCSNINNRIQQNKGKPIEIALCGGFILSEYVESIYHVFPNKSVGVFHTKEELLMKVKNYLEDEILREEMALKTYNKAIEHYDSVKGFEKIFHKIDTILPKKEKKLLLDDSFIKIHNTFNIYYLINYIINKKFTFAYDQFKYIMGQKKFILKDLTRYITYLIQFQIKRFKFNLKCKKLFYSLKKRNIVIYGSGEHTLNLYNKFSSFRDLNIIAIADQNHALWESKFKGIPIINPKNIKDYADDVIISSFKFEKDIEKYLKYNFRDINIHLLYSGIKEDLIHQIKDPYSVYRSSLKF